jgi:hypothetical protein
MKRLFFALAAIASVALPRPARAQSTQQKIQQAVDFYSKLEIDAARTLFLEILSSNWLQPVTTEQRVTALKYLGASYAISQKPDSAANYFTGALAYDAFTDLDRTAFSALELAAFDLAKARLFRVGMKPLPSRVVDPKSNNPGENQYSVRITTTQRAEVTITAALKANPRTDSLTEVVFRGINDGTRNIDWRGTMGGRIAPPGNYVMRISAQTQNSSRETVTDSLDFQVVHSYEPLEDTLPSLGARDTLVASWDSRGPLYDLIKGAALGVAAATIPRFALNSNKVDPTDKGKFSMHWQIAAGVGVGAGVFAFSYRRSHLLKPEAVAENLRRKQRRLEFNQGVERRNADRLDKTKLIITPR